MIIIFFSISVSDSFSVVIIEEVQQQQELNLSRKKEAGQGVTLFCRLETKLSEKLHASCRLYVFYKKVMRQLKKYKKVDKKGRKKQNQVKLMICR